MYLLVCPFCRHRTRVRFAKIGAHTCCPRCDEKFVLDADSLRQDPLEELENIPDETQVSGAAEALALRLQEIKGRRPDRLTEEPELPELPPFKKP